MSNTRISTWFPWVETPVIANAPMAGVISPELAAEVSKAGGFGFLGCIADLSENSPQVVKLDAELIKIRQLLGDAAATTPSGQLRIGVGFLSCHKTIVNFGSTALPVIQKHKPAAVWLFAPHEHLRPQKEIIRLLKGLETPPRVFVQVGNVTAAKEAIDDGADVIVCQGTDAGGHQFRRAMGVVPLLSETRKLVDEAGYDVAVFAAGGIADGKGVAAMLTLEADGVVLGTRFTVAEESIIPDFRKKIILDTVDGAISTLKSPFNDQIANSDLWGNLYDGRAVVGPIHEKYLAGASFYDCWRSLHDDHAPEESEKLINTWAGAAIGLVTKVQPAREIVREVQEETKQAIRKVAARV